MRPLKLLPSGTLLRRFRRERKGSMTVEFALLLVPFLLMTVGVLEIAIIQLTRTSLASAIEDTSRQIRTGQGGCITPNQYIAQLCSSMAFSGGDCMNNTKVIIEELANFTSSRTSGGPDFDAITNSIDAGRAESIMALQVFHRRNILVPLLDNALGGGSGQIMLVNNLAFRNEPFGAANGCATPPSP